MHPFDPVLPMARLYPLARTEERLSAATGDRSWWLEWWLAAGDWRFREATITAMPPLLNQVGNGPGLAVVLERRVDRLHADNTLTAGEWSAFFCAATPWKVVSSLGDTRFTRAISAHPFHAAAATRIHAITELSSALGRVQRSAAILRNPRRDEARKRDLAEGDGWQQVLKRHRLWSRWQRRQVSEAELEPVIAELRALLAEARALDAAQLEQLDAAAGAITRRLGRYTRPIGLPPLGRPWPTPEPITLDNLKEHNDERAAA